MITKDIKRVEENVMKKLTAVNDPSNNNLIDNPRLYTGMKYDMVVGSPEPNILA